MMAVTDIKNAPKKALRDTYGEMLVKLGKEDPDMVVLDADLSESTKTHKFHITFPDRFFNAGIAEQNMLGLSAGFAYTGRTVYASSFAIFLSGRAWEIIRQQIAYNGLNVKLVASHGGVSVGQDGASHQMNEDIAIMRALPNMNVIVPADSVEMEKVLEKVHYMKEPFYIRMGREKFPVIMPVDYEFELGKGFLLKEGDDVSVIACGVMVSIALQAAYELEEEGISVEVVNMASIKPIDRELIKQTATKTGAVVTSEEHSVIGGLGSAVSEVLSEEGCNAVLVRHGIEDRFALSGPAWEVMDELGLSVSGLKSKIRQALSKKCQK
ncbi:MAG: transketolase family protein [Hydrogenothermaceae bacterium]|nr:transketolase family protein [Hydrogenothermaceae bacterium]